jgi:hypothetical protein
MKKLIIVLFIALGISFNSNAQLDTVYICLQSYTPFTVLPDFCPNSPYYDIIVNGDTILVQQGQMWGAEFGQEGVAQIYCYDYYGFNDGIVDSTFYYIGNGNPEICLITSDNNNHPVFYFDTTLNFYGNYPMYVERQVTTTQWQTVGVINQGEVSYTDLAADTRTQSYHYRVASHGCRSAGHKTIHLSSNGNTLIWNEYNFNTTAWSSNPNVILRGYYINKRDINGVFTVIDSTVGLSYTDVNYQNGDEYFVETFKDDGCPPVTYNKTGSLQSIGIRSNTIKINLITGIDEREDEIKNYYVNGSTLYVNLKQTDDVWLFDLMGKEIAYERTSHLNIALNPGTYILRTKTSGKRIPVYY